MDTCAYVRVCVPSDSLTPSSHPLEPATPAFSLLLLHPPCGSRVQPDQSLSLDKSPSSRGHPVVPSVLAPTQSFPPASWWGEVPITAFQGERHGPGKTEEIGLPKPEIVERNRRAAPGDGDPVPPKRTCSRSSASPQFFLCRLEQCLCESCSSPSAP